MEFILFLIVAAATIYPMWKILERVGMQPAWSLICIVPLGTLVLLWVLAFSRWSKHEGAV